MKYFILVIAFLASIFSSPAHAESDWTTTDTALQVTYSVLHVMDWLQTRQIAANPDRWHETNPILGEHPSKGKVDAYFATTLIAHTAISYLLPKEVDALGYKVPARNIWQMVWIGVEAGYVAHNYSLGIQAKF